MDRVQSISTLSDDERDRVDVLDERFRYLIDGYNMSVAVIEDYLSMIDIDSTFKSNLFEQLVYVRNYLIDYFSEE